MENFFFNIHKLLLVTLVIVLSMLPMNLLAQETKIEVKKNENPYIHSYRDKLNVRPSIYGSVDELSFESQADGKILLKPNENLKLRLTLQHDFLALTVGFAPNFLPGNNDNKQKGKTSTFTFGLNIFAQQLFGRVEYFRSVGYYRDNLLNTAPFELFPDLSKQYFNFELAYSFNKNFSNRSYILFNERQKVSAGSFVLRTQFTKLQYENPDINEYRLRTNDRYLISGNYLYNYVFTEHFNILLGGGFGGGLALLNEKGQNNDSENSFINPVVQAHSITQIGYNKDNYFFGASFSINAIKDINPQTESVFKDTRLSGQIYFGYRFETPKFISNTFKKVRSILKRKT